MSIYGVSGASASAGGAWAKNDSVAKIGAAGERQVAKALEPYFSSPTSAALFHDLSVPGRSANIDHLIVSGKDVLLVDSKVWASGFYFTIFSHTYRLLKKDGRIRLERVDHADKHTYEMLFADLKKILSPLGAKILTPAVVVVSNSGTPRVRLYKPLGARAYTLDRFMDKSVLGTRLKPPDPVILSEIGLVFGFKGNQWTKS